METIGTATQNVASEMTKLVPLTWNDIISMTTQVARRNTLHGKLVYGVPTGGSIIASLLVSHGFLPVDSPDEAHWVVDDLVDSGNTLAKFTKPVDALFRKQHSPEHLAPHAHELNGWLVFPWEHSVAPEDAVVRLLEHIGENPTRPGLLDTPKRVAKAFREMTSGYAHDPKEILSRVFPDKSDEMVVLNGIRFFSLCEHHMLPFEGTATVGYIPTGRVVGISKLARLVECFARRLQVQERMTEEIAFAIRHHLNPLGVGVVIRARHLCMACRGVRQTDTDMVTSCMLGEMRDKPAARAEFLALARGNSGV